MNYKIPAALLLLITASTRAQTNIPITDFSFEGISTSISSPLLTGANSGSIGAWTGTASTLVSIGSQAIIGTENSATAPNGTNVLYMFAPHGTGTSVDTSDTLSQTLAANFATNSIYKLTFYLDSQSSLSLLNSDTISLTSGGTTVASLSGSSFTGLLAQNTFSLVTLTYTNVSDTADTGPIGINFKLNSATGTGLTSTSDETIQLDDFQLQWTPLIVASPTPEPSNTSLLGLSLGVLVFGLRRIVSRR